MGDCLVGNSAILQYSQTESFLYNIKTNEYVKIVYPDSKVTSCYGIWYNGGTSYTIVGGFSFDDINIIDIYIDGRPIPYGFAYIANYDSLTKQFSNWTKFKIDNNFTHIQGISFKKQNKKCYYQLSVSTIKNNDSFINAYYGIVRVYPNGNFSEFLTYKQIKYRDSKLISNNSVAGDAFVGEYFLNGKFSTYQGRIKDNCC